MRPAVHPSGSTDPSHNPHPSPHHTRTPHTLCFLDAGLLLLPASAGVAAGLLSVVSAGGDMLMLLLLLMLVF